METEAAAAVPGRVHPAPTSALALGAPGDAAEQQAERVAGAVATALAGGTGDADEVRASREHAKRTATHELARGAVAGSTAGPVDPVHADAIAAQRRAGGEPLPAGVAAELTELLQRDLSRIRIHRGAAADALARSLGAVAFTVGQDIFVSAAGDDGGARGRALLAHEVAHAVQQGAHGDGVVQRALGIEIECAKLPITHAPKGAKKGDALKQTSAWRMMYEETTTGQPVVEFKTEPAPSVGKDFVRAVKEMAKEAARIPQLGAEYGKHGEYFVEAPDRPDVGATVQVTAGAPLDKIAQVYRAFGQTSAVTAIGDLVATPSTDEELGIDLSTLTPRGRGFLFLVADYVRRGHVPMDGYSKEGMTRKRTGELERWQQMSDRLTEEDEEYEEVAEQVERSQTLLDRTDDDSERGYRGVKRFPKATFGVLARNNFTAIFATLARADQRELTSTVQVRHTGRNPRVERVVVLRNRYVDWLVQESTKGGDDRSIADKRDEPLINIAFSNDERIPLQRGKWLRRLPTHDKLADIESAQVGTYPDDHMDRASSGPAPLLEFRELSEELSKPDPKTWGRHAAKLWKAYQRAVGERVYRGNERGGKGKARDDGSDEDSED